MPPRLLGPVPKEELTAIEKYLRTHNLGKNIYRRRVGEGVSQCLGIVGKRCLPPDLSRQSWLHPELHHLLMQFAEKHVPISFTSIQVNHNFPCNPHRDIGNIGESYIVGFGSYRGGSLCVAGMGYDIRYRGLLFDGSQLTHWTTPWTDDRFTIVFHTIAPKFRFGSTVPSINAYKAVIDDTGAWKIRRESDGLLLDKKSGLPHPLRKS